MERKNIWDLLRALIPGGNFYRVDAIPYRDSGNYRILVETDSPNQRVFIQLNGQGILEYISDDSCLINLLLNLQLGENELRWRGELDKDWKVIKLYITRESLLHASLFDTGIVLINKTDEVFYMSFNRLDVLSAWLANEQVSNLEQVRLLKQLYFLWGDSWRAIRQKAIGEGKSEPYFIDKLGNFTVQRNLLADETLVREDSYFVQGQGRISDLELVRDRHLDFGGGLQVIFGEEPLPEIVSIWLMIWISNEYNIVDIFKMNVLNQDYFIAVVTVGNYDNGKVLCLIFRGDYYNVSDLVYSKAIDYYIDGKFCYGNNLLAYRYIYDEELELGGYIIFSLNVFNFQYNWCNFFATDEIDFQRRGIYYDGKIFLTGEKLWGEGFVLCLDSSDGQELWRAVVRMASGYYDFLYLSVISNYQGDLYYLVNFYTFPETSVYRMVKFDVNGNVSWVLGFPSDYYVIVLGNCACLFDESGNPVLFCMSESNNYKFLCVKLNKQTGQVLLAKDLFSVTIEELVSACQVDSGVYIIEYKENQSDFVLACINFNTFQVLWAKKYTSVLDGEYEGLGGTQPAFSLLKTSRGYVVSILSSWLDDGYGRGTLLEIDSQGNLLAEGIQNIQGIDVTQQVQFGNTLSPSIGTVSDVVVTKSVQQSMQFYQGYQWVDAGSETYEFIDVTQDFPDEKKQIRPL